MGRSLSATEQLWTILSCCSSSADRPTRLALGLRECGLAEQEIAARFLAPADGIRSRFELSVGATGDSTIHRLGPHDPRFADVMQVLYLLFTAGYSSLSTSPDYCEQAITLTRRLLRDVDHAEVEALLALMLLHHARRPGRARAGHIVKLADQDRATWNWDAVVEARELLRSAATVPTTYYLQACIAAEHTREEAQDTNWDVIVGLYRSLYRIEPSPVVALNYAIALSMTESAEVALSHVERLAPDLSHHHTWHATRADLLKRLGRREEALAAYREAYDLGNDELERRYLHDRIVELEEP